MTAGRRGNMGQAIRLGLPTGVAQDGGEFRSAGHRHGVRWAVRALENRDGLSLGPLGTDQVAALA